MTMTRLDEDWAYQLQEDARLAALTPDEWRYQLAADEERIRQNHARQAVILRRAGAVSKS